MMITIPNKWLKIIKALGLSIVVGFAVYSIAVWVEDATDDYSHYHQFTVVEVLNCMGEDYVKCRVELDNGKEAIVNDMTAVGYSVNRYSYIKDEDGGTEWYYTTLSNGKTRPTDDASHDAAWERYRKENR